MTAAALVEEGKRLGAEGGEGLRVLWVSLLLRMLAEAACGPMLPYFLTEDLGADALSLGWSVSLSAAAQMGASLALGSWGDVGGSRKKAFLATLASGAASSFLCGFSKSLRLWFVARALAGVSGAAGSVAQALVAESCKTQLLRPPREERQLQARLSGLCLAADSAGLVLGPALGGLCVFAFGSRRFLFLCSGGLAALSFLCAAFFVEEPPRGRGAFLSAAAAAAAAAEEGGEVLLLRAMWMEKLQQIRRSGGGCRLQLAVVCFLRIATAFSSAVVGGAYFLLLREAPGPPPLRLKTAPDAAASQLLTASGACLVLYQALLYRRVFRVLEAKGTMRLGVALQGAGVLCVWRTAAWPLPLHVLVFCTTFSLALSLVEPNLPVLAAALCNPKYQGITHGLMNSCRFVAAIVAPAVYGRLYSWNTAAPFFLAAALCAFSLLLLRCLDHACEATGNKHQS